MGFLVHSGYITLKEGLSIQADNVATTSLLKEWCDVCQEQCVVDQEVKAKQSISLVNATCGEVQEILTQNIWAEKHKGRWLFRKQPKGDWVAYTCKRRLPSEIAAKLKQVLSPAGKYDHIMADNPSSQLWLPKTFYNNHIEIIASLDVESHAFIMHITWVRLNHEVTNNGYFRNSKRPYIVMDEGRSNKN